MGSDALRLFAFLCLAVLPSGCGWWPADTTRTMSVDDVLKSIHVLNGKTVKVEGYMPKCGGYDCTLFVSEQAHKDFWRVILDRESKEEAPEFLSIDFDEKFDRKADPLAGSYVVVTGRVSDECRDAFGRLRCTDRASDIIPIDIAPRPKRSAASSTNG